MKLNNKTHLGKLRNLSITASVVATSFLAIESGSAAVVIWSDGFSSAPFVNSTVDNGNTNRGGTGAANDMNQDEWYTRGTRSTISHDSGNGNITIALNGNNVYLLMDLTDLENDPGALTEFTISFDVESIGGSVNFWAWSGGGLDYNGTTTGNGHLFFRTYLDPPLFNANNGATRTLDIDTAITSTGTFTTSPITLTDLDEFGDYVAIGFGGSPSLTIDNLQLTAVPEPSSSVLLLGGLAGLVLRRRRS